MSDRGDRALVALGFAIVVVRRRSLAIALVGAQALLLGIVALSIDSATAAGMAVAGVILVVRAAALPALLVLARRHSREPALVAPATTMVTRLVIAAARSRSRSPRCRRSASPTAPPNTARWRSSAWGSRPSSPGGRDPADRRGLVAENGVYLLAVAVPGGLPSAIELGVLFDLALVVTVSVAFSRKIHEEVGSGDVDLLRGLRD